MSGYTPIFDTVYHGTLCGKWPTLPVWLTILPMADKNGHIDLTYQAISVLTGWPIDLLKQAFAELMAPDPESRSPDEDGRRLVLIDPENRSWGWRVVNHRFYREKVRKHQSDQNRIQNGSEAARKRESRAVPRCPAQSDDVPPSEAEANTDTYTHKTPLTAANHLVPEDRFEEIKTAYPKREGSHRWANAKGSYRERLKEGSAHEDILAGVRRYAAYVRANGDEGTRYVQQAATFLGTNKGFLEDWKIGPKRQSGSTETALVRPVRMFNQ